MSVIQINGRECPFEGEKTILEVARGNGIYIPSLCYHKKTGPAGMCRACAVEVEGMRGLQTSCSVMARDGMKVTSNSVKALEAQKMVVDLLLSSGNHDCLACEQNGQCELQDAAYFLGIERGSFKYADIPRELDVSSQCIQVDRSKCIACGRCVSACNNVVVNEILDFKYRGHETAIVFDDDRQMGESGCVQCGECVQLCPVGALVDKKSVGKGRPWQLEKVDTTCPYCGVGCQVTLHVDKQKNKIVRVTGRETLPNQGMLCAKGRYGYEFPSNENRLKYPMIRKNGEHIRVSWDQALDYTASRIKALVDRHGPDTFSAFGSGRITNENNYAIQKFTRGVIKTNNVDHCARACHAPTVAGLAAAFGSGAMTNSIKEIGDAQVLFVIGSNTTEAHPVISYFMKQSVKKGGTLIVNDPRKIDLTRWAGLHVQHKVGTDVPYLNAVINEIFAKGWEDKEFLANCTENPDQIREWVKEYTPETASEICGVPAETIRQVARILGTANSASVCYTLGITEHICGTDNVKTIANLQMVLGNLGKYAAGVNPLRGQNNVQGACDMGALPNVFHTYQPVDKPGMVAKFEKAWGVTGMSARPGYNMPTMLHKALDGGTRVLYCVGDNTVQTEPNMAHTIKELEALDFFVCVDIFPTITTPYADVIFPDTAWGEEDGTFTNSERRVQRVRAALKAPGEARSHWWVMQELGKRLGVDLGFTSSQAVYEDMRRSSTSYTGITWDRISEKGLQWPCPGPEHPGTKFMHKDGKFTRGKGLFHHTVYRQQAEPPDHEYPLVLSTGRRLWHYHSGTQTRNCVGLEALFPEELMEVSPVDAENLGIKTGDKVKAISRRGEIRLTAWVTERSAPGVCWCSFHFWEACGNVLTIDAFDNVTETAEYKACAIKLEKVADGTMNRMSDVRRQARP